MAAPNLLSVSTITGKTAYTALSTATSNVIVNSTGSGTVVKLNNIILSNRTANNVASSILVNRSATEHFLAGNVVIPANSSLVILAKDTTIYLEEGDTLQANVTANSAVTITASYELVV